MLLVQQDANNVQAQPTALNVFGLLFGRMETVTLFQFLKTVEMELLMQEKPVMIGTQPPGTDAALHASKSQAGSVWELHLPADQFLIILVETEIQTQEKSVMIKTQEKTMVAQLLAKYNQDGHALPIHMADHRSVLKISHHKG